MGFVLGNVFPCHFTYTNAYPSDVCDSDSTEVWNWYCEVGNWLEIIFCKKFCFGCLKFPSSEEEIIQEYDYCYFKWKMLIFAQGYKG